MNGTFIDEFGEEHYADRAKRFRTSRACMVLGHLLGAKQSLREIDSFSANQHIESALVPLRQLMAFEKEGST